MRKVTSSNIVFIALFISAHVLGVEKVVMKERVMVVENSNCSLQRHFELTTD